MHIRTKTKRRLLVLAGLLFVVGTVTIWVLVASSHRNVANKKIGEAGLAAYRAGDFEKAYALLFDYRERTANLDPVPDIELAFADSCATMGIPARQHDAIHTYELYLQHIKPGDVAQRRLLKLYAENNSFPEAVRLADEILAKDPRDVEVLKRKAQSLWFQDMPRVNPATYHPTQGIADKPHAKQALAISQQINEIAPLDLEAQFQTLRFMVAAGTPDDKLVAHVEKLRLAHDQDARFELLLGVVYLLKVNQPELGTKWLKSATARPVPDAEFVMLMVKTLDNAGYYPDSASYLARAADAVADSSVQYALAQRMWQDGKSKELLHRLEKRQATTPAADVILLSGYRALALRDVGRLVEARKLVESLSHRSDFRSAAWAMGLAVTFADPQLKPSDAIARLQQAIERDAQNPVLHALLAQSYLSTGETERVLQQCDLSLQFAPAWAEPDTIAAAALLAARRNRDAFARAETAYYRAREDLSTATIYVEASFALAADSGVAANYAELIPKLQGIQQSWHDAGIVPMYVQTLARAGKRDVAVSLVRTALAVNPPLPSAVLVKIAEAVEEENLGPSTALGTGLAQEVRDAAQKAHGLTSEIAFAQAMALGKAGKVPEGLKLVLDAAKGHEGELPWRLNIAKFRDEADAGAALKDWVALGDQYPSEMGVQQAILRSHARGLDREFWKRTIDRMKVLTGEQGLEWRIERSRWLLAGDLSERDQGEAANLLTQVTREAPLLPEPYVLLSKALKRASASGSLEALKSAARVLPGDPIITRELVPLLSAEKHKDEAIGALEKLAQNPRLGSQDRDWLVQAFVTLDAGGKAIEVLEKEDDLRFDHGPRLASLYRRVGRADDAARIYKGLLGKPVTNPEFWLEAADFLGGRNDLTSANQLLEKLAEVPLKAGDFEIVLAELTEKWKSPDDALKQFQAAVKIAPRSVGAWQALAAFHMRFQHFTEAASAAAEGLKLLPADPTLKAVQANANALAGLRNAGEFGPLIAALCRDPRDAAAREMLAAIAAARNTNATAVILATRIREVADRHQDNPILQTQAVRSLVRAGSNDTALDIALRLESADPRHALPQQLLAELYTGCGDWAKAEKAALLWRQYSLDRPMQADVALARIYLQQPGKDLAGAITALAPYVSATTAAQNPEILQLYVTALIRANRSAEAADLLTPLLADSADWRGEWLTQAVSQKDAAAASAWIDRVTPLIPQDASSERVALANAWYAVGERFSASEALENAGQILEPLLADGKSLPKTYLLAGQLAVARSKYPAAESAYRRALELDPSSADARNNLAYVLWAQDQNLPEARTLAEAAVAARPQDAKFYDTLGRIQARAGDRKGAIQSFRNALSKDRNSMEAMIGLADLLARDKATRKEATELIAKVKDLLELNPRLPVVIRKQYQTAREALATSL